MYKITRAYQTNKALTRAQRTSGLFAEEPLVGGKTLRRNGPPLILNEDQYKMLSTRIALLLKAEAIKVEKLPETVPVEPLVPLSVLSIEEKKEPELDSTLTPDVKEDTPSTRLEKKPRKHPKE